MKRIKFYCLCMALILGNLTGKVFSQDTFYTQFFSVPMLINPAYAGINTGVKARFDYRNQWPVLPKSYQAYYFSADYGDRGLPGAGGIGLIFNSDNEGTGFIHNLEAGLDISVRIRITSMIVSQIGIKASYRQKTVNWDDFVFTDELSAKYGNINPTTFNTPGTNRRSAADFGVGGLLQFISEDQAYQGTVGFAVDHLFQPDMSFLSTGEAPLYRRWVVHADGVFALGGGGSMSGGSGDALRINPGVVFQQQYNVSNLEIGFNLSKYNVYLGTWYKTSMTKPASNSLAVLAGYNLRVADNIAVKFIYSYDIPISGAYSSSGGAHEISLVLSFEGFSLFGGGTSGTTIPRGGGSKKWGALECSDFY